RDGSRRAAAARAAGVSRLVLRGGGIRPLRGQAVADGIRVGGCGALEPTREQRVRAQSRHGVARQRRSTVVRHHAHRELRSKLVPARLLWNDRRRVGMDLERFPAVSGISHVSLSRKKKKKKKQQKQPP